MSGHSFVFSDAHKRVLAKLLGISRPQFYHWEQLSLTAVHRAAKTEASDPVHFQLVSETAVKVRRRLAALDGLSSRVATIRGEAVRGFVCSEDEVDCLVLCANLAGFAVNDRATPFERRVLVNLLEQLSLVRPGLGAEGSRRSA